MNYLIRKNEKIITQIFLMITLTMLEILGKEINSNIKKISRKSDIYCIKTNYNVITNH